MSDVQSSSALGPASRTNTTFSAPSGIVDGDLLLILMTTGRNPAITPTPPSGFVAPTGFSATMDSFAGDPYVVRLHCWWKIAASESGSYATTHATADTLRRSVC